MDGHSISVATLDRFAHHTATEQEQRAVVRHLLGGCEICRRYLARLWPSFLKSRNVVELSPTSYDGAFEKAAKVASGSAGEALGDLEFLPPLRQELLVRNHPRFWKREFCQEFIERAHAARFSSMPDMRQYSWLAVLVAMKMKPSRRGEETQIEDLRARAWLGYANALRVSGDYNAAEPAFLNAQSHLRSGSGALSLRARFLKQLSSLRLDQRKFEDFRTLIHEATEIWRDLHNRQGVTRGLIVEAVSAGHQGNPGSALDLLARAERSLDGTEDSELGLILIHARTRFLAENGQVDAAFDLYSQLREQVLPRAEPLLLNKFTWLKGQLHCLKGDLELAVEALSTVHQNFLSQGNACDAGVVGLELAAVLGKLGRRREMRILAAAAFQEMAARRIVPESLAALLLLRKSA